MNFIVCAKFIGEIHCLATERGRLIVTSTDFKLQSVRGGLAEVMPVELMAHGGAR